jgi:hypothetical protein
VLLLVKINWKYNIRYKFGAVVEKRPIVQVSEPHCFLPSARVGLSKPGTLITGFWRLELCSRMHLSIDQPFPKP